MLAMSQLLPPDDVEASLTERHEEEGATSWRTTWRSVWLSSDRLACVVASKPVHEWHLGEVGEGDPHTLEGWRRPLSAALGFDITGVEMSQGFGGREGATAFCVRFPDVAIRFPLAGAFPADSRLDEYERFMAELRKRTP